jgi:hypothetical protein
VWVHGRSSHVDVAQHAMVDVGHGSQVHVHGLQSTVSVARRGARQYRAPPEAWSPQRATTRRWNSRLRRGYYDTNAERHPEWGPPGSIASRYTPLERGSYRARTYRSS